MYVIQNFQKVYVKIGPGFIQQSINRPTHMKQWTIHCATHMHHDKKIKRLLNLTSLFSLALSSICSSMVPLQMSRQTVTCLVWPSRWARSMACWSTVGFQSLSQKITVSAAVRLIPRPPARVLSKNTKMSDLDNIKDV